MPSNLYNCLRPVNLCRDLEHQQFLRLALLTDNRLQRTESLPVFDLLQVFDGVQSFGLVTRTQQFPEFRNYRRPLGRSCSGRIIALLQALTQIQEATLTFVPKVLAMLIVLVLTLPFVISTLTEYNNRLFEKITHIE